MRWKIFFLRNHILSCVTIKNTDILYRLRSMKWHIVHLHYFLFQKGWKIWENKAINCTFFSKLSEPVFSKWFHAISNAICSSYCNLKAIFHFINSSRLSNVNKMIQWYRAKLNKRLIMKHRLLICLYSFFLHDCNDNQPQSSFNLLPAMLQKKGVFRSW